MSDWSTVFVEVPLGTFNPVKTVNDLLRETASIKLLMIRSKFSGIMMPGR